MVHLKKNTQYFNEFRFVLWRVLNHWVALGHAPIGLDSRPAGVGKAISWYPMLPSWSLPTYHHLPLYQTLVKLRLPDFPEVLEATQPNNLVNACLQVLHLLKHLQGIPFASVLGRAGTILSASRTQNQQLIANAKKKPRNVYIYM